MHHISILVDDVRILELSYIVFLESAGCYSSCLLFTKVPCTYTVIQRIDFYYKVLQSPKDLELQLRSPLSKEKHRVVATISLHGITSKPIHYEDGKTAILSGAGQYSCLPTSFLSILMSETKNSFI